MTGLRCYDILISAAIHRREVSHSYCPSPRKYTLQEDLLEKTVGREEHSCLFFAINCRSQITFRIKIIIYRFFFLKK